LQTVYADRDDGPMSLLSRWQPRRVFCTEHADHADRPGTLHVVKFRRGPVGTAALISEVVCGHLLEEGGLRVLDRRLVEVSDGLARAFNVNPDRPYEIEPGLHFGTVLRSDVVDGPPLELAELADPQELLDVWAFDTLFCTTDRAVTGNLLLEHDAAGKAHLIPADQSDGFGGAGRFADGTWRNVLDGHAAAATVPFYQAAILQLKARGLEQAIDKVRRAAAHVEEALAQVPPSWWAQAGIDPQEVRDRLGHRSRRLSEFLNLPLRQGLGDDIRGAHLL
jgi:hypothetical protein